MKGSKTATRVFEIGGGRSRGQFIVAGIVFLCILMVVVQAMVWWAQREAYWSNQSTNSSNAFYMAETGANRAIFQLTDDASNPQTILAGSTLSGYNFDKVYTDVSGGQYAIQISSNSSGSIVVKAVGEDLLKKETRAVEVIYAATTTAGIAPVVYANGGVTLSGNAITVDWGAVASRGYITTGGRSSPQFWSTTDIDLDTNGATPPNADSPNACQWHSYDTSLPAMPTVNLTAYKTSATATSTYYSGDQNWGGWMDFGTPTNTEKGYTFYIDGNLTIDGAMHFLGNLVVNGNLTLPSGNFGSGVETLSVPQNAWQQYCLNWQYYKDAFDSHAPASFPGMGSDYVSASTLTYTAQNVFLHGLMYVTGNVVNQSGGWGGWGGATGNQIVGAMYVQGCVNLSNSGTGDGWWNDFGWWGGNNWWNNNGWGNGWGGSNACAGSGNGWWNNWGGAGWGGGGWGTWGSNWNGGWGGGWDGGGWGWNSGWQIFYDPNVAGAISATTVSMSQSSWTEIASCSWTGTTPVCH